MRTEGFENLTHAGHIVGNRERGKQRITYPRRLCKWMTEHGRGAIVKRQTLLSATKDYKLWRVMIGQILEGYDA